MNKIRQNKFEVEVLKEVLRGSLKMYQEKIRSTQKQLSWYNHQLENIQNQLDKLENLIEEVTTNADKK